MLLLELISSITLNNKFFTECFFIDVQFFSSKTSQICFNREYIFFKNYNENLTFTLGAFLHTEHKSLLHSERKDWPWPIPC